MKWYCFIFLCNVCVVRCHSIAVSEIEDFSNFLKETSQLDQNVKSAFPGNDYDDDEAISDDAWEESGKFEGDLILNERQRRLIVANVAEGLARNGLTDTTKRWPNNEVIYFIQQEHFTSDQIQAIQDGIDDLARVSCVKFTPYKKGDRDAVVIQGSRRGCFSQVGYQGGYQVLNLSGRHPVGRGCFRHGTVVHELLHTLGFYHMQSSHDRDDYIDIIWENILRPARHNFRKYNSFSVSDFGVGYDYDSVLHYSRKAFSANGQDTIVPKQGGSNIGQRIGLSDKDVQKLNKMYCDANSELADENSESKKPVTKKKAKNRPFEGHGIGYQQGKTVIIKLPTNEQSEVVYSPQIMYHFSSEPKTMQETAFEHGYGSEKEIDHDFHPLTLISQTNSENFPRAPNQQHHQHSNKPETSNIHSEGNEETSNDNKELDDALHRFANVIKTHKNPYPSTIDYDYSKYINPENEKPKIKDELMSLHRMNSNNLKNKYSINSGRPIYLTKDKMNKQFYNNYNSEDVSPDLRTDHKQSDSLELIDQQNYEYVPRSQPLVLRNQSYINILYDPEKQLGIQRRFPARGRISIYDPYIEDNEEEEPNNNKHFIYEDSNLSNYPSVKDAHITERYTREPYTPQYSYSAPVSHNWRNDRNPSYENYKNKYHGTAEDYR